MSRAPYLVQGARWRTTSWSPTRLPPLPTSRWVPRCTTGNASSSKTTGVPKPSLPTVKPPWQACAFVCRKCSKKVGGKQGKRFARNLREALRSRFGKKGSRVVEVGCLDLCPKDRIVVGITSATAPLKLILASAESPPDQILEALMPSVVAP